MITQGVIKIYVFVADPVLIEQIHSAVDTDKYLCESRIVEKNAVHAQEILDFNPDILITDCGHKLFASVLSHARMEKPDMAIVGVVNSDESSDTSDWDIFDGIVRTPIIRAEFLFSIQKFLKAKKLQYEHDALSNRLNTAVHESLKNEESFQKIVNLSKALIDTNSCFKIGPEFLKIIAENMSAEGGSLFLKNEDKFVCVCSVDPSHEPPAISLPLNKDSVFGRALEKKQAIFVSDITNEQYFSQSGWDGYNDGSSVVFPLSGENGDIVALLSLHNKSVPPFISKDLEIGQVIISQAYLTARLNQLLKAYKESEKKYRLIAENVSDVIWQTDLEMRFTYMSPSVKKLLGYHPEELRGKTAKDVLTFSSFEIAVKALAEDLTSEDMTNKRRSLASRILELKMLCKDGSAIWTEAKISFIRDENDRPLGIMGISRDISIRLNLESQLRHAQKMEAVGTLAGGIAHDFNNLLQAIQGYSELLLYRKDENDKDFKKLKEIVRTSKRAGELTQQLLTFSRKVESKMRPIRVNRELEQVVKLLRRTIPKMISINLKKEKDLKNIFADPMQIEQILINLAVNAKDAMADGGRIDIETQNVSLDPKSYDRYPEMDPGDYCLISVSDSGTGIPDDIKSKIFDPFFTTKSMGEGTGLGLSMVYGIVKSHNGLIMCTSEEGKGSRFDIYFPAIEDSAVDDYSSNEDERPAGGTETILLVDDEIVIRNLCELILTKLGYTVLKASDGESALNIFNTHKAFVDLVILDIVMPGMGGEKCLKELLKIRKDVKVIIASGFSGEMTLGSLHEASVKAFIHKPYEMNYLVSTIRDVLDIKEKDPPS